MGKIKLLLALVLLAVVGVGLSRISFNVDILKLLPGNLTQVRGLSLFLEHFALPNELLITVEGDDANDVETATTALAAKLRTQPALVKRAVDTAPWESHPEDLAELIAYLLLNQPPARIAELTHRLAPAEAPRIAQAAVETLSESMAPADIAMLGYDPFGLGASLFSSGLIPEDMKSEFSSADGKFRVVYVEAAKPIENYEDAIEWIGKIRKLAEEGVAGQPVKLGFTGQPAFVADISGTMKWDMISSSCVTMLVIGFIFWLCYRRVRPLLDLLLMLVIVFVVSMGIAGLFLHELTIIGVGFASIMIGLSVDYGYLVYQKSLHQQGTLRDLQWDSFRNILWTAGTTAAAFFALNLSSLPGLSQLGNLVGIGVIVGAVVMILIFARITQMWKKSVPAPTFVERAFHTPAFLRAGAWVTGLVLVALAVTLVIKGPPPVDSSAGTLRPRHSGAYDAMDQLYAKLADDRDLLSLLVTGATEEEVFTRLEKADAQLQAARARGEIRSYHTALPLWPHLANQRANLPVLGALAAEAPRLEQTLADAGFAPEAFGLTRAILDRWATWAKQTPPIWPGNAASQWIMRRAASRTAGESVALGIVRATPGDEDKVVREIQTEGVYLVSWGQLGAELQRVVPGEFLKLIGGLVGIVLVLLLIGFRSLRDVGLLVFSMALVFVALAGAMRVFDLSWNFFNMAALLLLLGTGIDYGILMLLALRRNGGDVPEAQRTIGLVVALCAAAAAAGFGTIGWANNRGLASLGVTCALGLALDALISIFLLPVLWRMIHPARRA
ncbi:MAG TPA: MMPL family transporter [Chthoniobacterales bacterium]